MKISTTGRRDVTEFFEKSGIRESTKLPHTPALLFIEYDDYVDVIIINDPRQILDFADDVPVMMQWQGKWRSDFFKFTVGEFRNHIEQNPPSSYMVI